MRVTVLFREINGWPRIIVEKPVFEHKDTVRLNNWGIERWKDLTAVAAEHARLTEESRKTGRRSVATFRGLFQKAFGTGEPAPCASTKT